MNFTETINALADNQDIEGLALMLRHCRNELCAKCGCYRGAHMGACDGCRWAEVS